MKNPIYTMFTLIAFLLLASACSQTQTPKDPATDSLLEKGTYKDKVSGIPDKLEPKSFKDENELLSFINSHESSSYGYYGGQRGGMVLEDAIATKQASAQAPDAETDFSKTNNQETGVDEADILKTDGEYIYTITDKTLYILKAHPAEDADVVSKITFKNRPTSLFVKDDKLAVFGNIDNLDEIKQLDFSPRSGLTFFNVYDISEREEPELEKEYKFEGRYFDGRMIDENVYFVVNSQPRNRGIPPMPIIIDGPDKRHVPASDITYFNIPYNNPTFITVHAINLENNENTDSETITVDYGQELYMSKNNIFITYTERKNEHELQQEINRDLLRSNLTEEDKELIEKIKQTDNDVLSQAEKERKIMQVYEAYLRFMDYDEREALEDKTEEKLKEKLEEMKYLEYTIVNKLEVDNGEVDTDANGKVPGHIINQFALDEKDDVLRIATTVSARWSRLDGQRTESENNVYTLDKDLEILGKIEGLAKDESIYSTRFMGDKLYMVTFKQVDPFFVIDLSNPKEPENLGKLKIPGFSRYLHPYDEDTIIGIGRNATSTGRSRGLKVSLFDVSDFEDPKEVASFVTQERYAQSTALYEHKAFLFSKEKNLMVIPAMNRYYSWRTEEREDGYNGAFVFEIAKDEIELRGLVDHSGNANNYYNPAVERSLYIEDMLYTKSPNLLRINAIDDLSSVKNITLKPKEDQDIPIY